MGGGWGAGVGVGVACVEPPLAPVCLFLPVSATGEGVGGGWGLGVMQQPHCFQLPFPAGCNSLRPLAYRGAVLCVWGVGGCVWNGFIFVSRYPAPPACRAEVGGGVCELLRPAGHPALRHQCAGEEPGRGAGLCLAMQAGRERWGEGGGTQRRDDNLRPPHPTPPPWP